jgi:hypothetical protein
VALSALIVLAIAPSVAQASASWSPPIPVDSSPLQSVSCPSTSFCIAVDSGGGAVTFNGTAWSAPEDIDGKVPLTSVSCPSTSFCVAVDSAGSAMTFNGTAWSAPEDIDGAIRLNSVSCASAAFCVAVDWAGKAVTLNGTAWSAPEDIDGAGSLSSVSCASAAFCVAVDKAGHAITYSGTWGAPASVDPTHSLSSVSCPSASFCLGVDVDSYFVTYEGGSWSAPRGLVVEQLSFVSCPSELFCAAVNDGNGYAMTYDGSEWGSTVRSIEMSGGLRSVSCSSAAFCAAVDDAGNAFIYSTPPLPPASTSPPVISGSAVGGALSRVLVPSGRGRKIRALLRHRGYSAVFDAPSAGRLTISWYVGPGKARGKQLVLIAKLSVSVHRAGAAVVTITLTRRGRQLLGHSHRLSVISTGRFAATGQPATSVTKRFTLTE